jgi:uncharacterized protein (TIGR03435 family)
MDRFEVASVKPAGQQGDGPRIVMSGGPGTSDPGQITYLRVPLKRLIAVAYGTDLDQILGPDWLTDRYDLTAKIPSGATKEQFSLMLQDLLATRFKIVLHHETQFSEVYELVLAKSGPKLKKSVESPSAAPDQPRQLQSPSDIHLSRDGFPQLPSGVGTLAAARDGRMFVTFNKFSLTDLTAWLGLPLSALTETGTVSLGRVVDKTGLAGIFDFTLEFAGTLGPGGAYPPPDLGGPDLFTALEKQLGLKLEERKGSTDVLVIDHSEKTPTEN